MARPSSGGNEPIEFCCPISDEIMEDPVVLIQSGQTYDRKSITEWFRKGNSTCPSTGVPLKSIQLTPNFALKAAIQNWRQRREATPAPGHQNGDISYLEPVKGSMYPEPAKDNRPQDKIAQVVAAARKLRSGSLEDRVFREQRIYELWTLSELMSDPHCRDELINHSLLPLIARFLAEDNVAGCKAAAARILQRLAIPPAASQVYNTLHPDGIVNLVRVLGVADPAALNRPSCREAAANALRDLAPISRPAHDEIFIQLCKRSNELGANFSFVAPLRLLFQVPANSDSRAAAELICQITKSTPLKDYQDYSSCAGTQTIPSLVNLLASPDAQHSGTAKAALAALLYTPNQPSMVYELLQGLGSHDRASQEACGLLLWEKAAENINLVAVIISTPNFAPCLEASLRGRSLAGAGLVQLMTCDHARPSNSVVTPPNTDATRMQLMSHEQVLPSLVQLSYSEDPQTIMAALHALANLAAFRSSSTSTQDTRFRRHSSGNPATSGHPSAMVAASEALPRLMALLNCQDPAIVAPALALLNNLVAENDNRDKVREAVKQWGHDAWKSRLEGLMGWGMLPDKCRAAARSALQRLQAGRLERSPEHFSLITLMMRPPS